MSGHRLQSFISRKIKTSFFLLKILPNCANKLFELIFLYFMHFRLNLFDFTEYKINDQNTINSIPYEKYPGQLLRPKKSSVRLLKCWKDQFCLFWIANYSQTSIGMSCIFFYRFFKHKNLLLLQHRNSLCCTFQFFKKRSDEHL